MNVTDNDVGNTIFVVIGTTMLILCLTLALVVFAFSCLLAIFRICGDRLYYINDYFLRRGYTVFGEEQLP